MKEFEEDNLENFFRNRADDDQYEFREEDWEKMKAKLDKADTVAAFSFSKYFWMALGAAITSLMFIGYIKFSSPDAVTAISQNEQTKESLSVTDNTTSQSLAEKRSNNTLGDDSSVKPTEQPQESGQNQDSEGTLSNVNSTIQTQDMNLDKSAHEDKFTNHQAIPVSIVVNSNGNNMETIDTNKVLEVSEKNTGPKSGTTGNIDVQGADYRKAEYQFSIIPVASPDLHKKELLESNSVRRFYWVGVIAAMDVSSTSESQWGKPALRLGLSGEYFINDRFSLGVGVNISNKNYVAKGREYAPPKGFWTNGVVPDSTNAICKVLDVPVTLSYYHPIGKKGSLIFHAGMSSWFMLEEDYYYKYTSNDPDLIKGWHGKNENRYWFGIVNLAVSYELMINEKWSLMAGPYYNLPLTGVGHGNVELKSFGMRASLRLNKYKLPKIN